MFSVTDAKALPNAAAHLKDWLEAGLHGGMHYLSTPAARDRPSLVMENAKSIISVAMNYNPGGSSNESSLSVSNPLLHGMPEAMITTASSKPNSKRLLTPWRMRLSNPLFGEPVSIPPRSSSATTRQQAGLGLLRSQRCSLHRVLGPILCWASYW